MPGRRMRALGVVLVVVVALSTAGLTAPGVGDVAGGLEGATGSVVFERDDADPQQKYVVPEGVHRLEVELWGASGGDGGTCLDDLCGPGGRGGLGAHVRASIDVDPGETLTIIVGGRGFDGLTHQAGRECPGFHPGGWGGPPGGAHGGAGACPGAPGGGGGSWAAVVRGDPSDPASRELLVSAGAGGGGGGGGTVVGAVVLPAGGDGGASGETGEDGEGDVCEGGGGSGGNVGSTPGGGSGGDSATGSDGDPGTDGGVAASAPTLGWGGDGGGDTPSAGGGGGGGGLGVIVGGGGGGGGARADGCSGPGGGGGGGRSYFGAGASGTVTEGVHAGDGRVVVTPVHVAQDAPPLPAPTVRVPPAFTG